MKPYKELARKDLLTKTEDNSLELATSYWSPLDFILLTILGTEPGINSPATAKKGQLMNNNSSYGNGSHVCQCGQFWEQVLVKQFETCI